MAPRPESLQSAIPNPARIRKWKCVSKRRIHRSEICIEPQDGGRFGRKGRMDANPIGKGRPGGCMGTAQRERPESKTETAQNAHRQSQGMERFPGNRAGWHRERQGGAENPKRSLLRIRPWAREIRAEPAEHGAKTPPGWRQRSAKKGPAFRFGKARPTEIGPMEEVVSQRDTRSDGTEERNGQRQAGRGPYSMSSVRRMSQGAKSEAQEQERNHKRKRLPFPAMEKATFFLCSSKG